MVLGTREISGSIVKTGLMKQVRNHPTWKTAYFLKLPTLFSTLFKFTKHLISGIIKDNLYKGIYIIIF